jgi:hypothetical protein
MRVNLDSTVWTDARFSVLATLMGWESVDTAIARSARVWRQCTIESRCELSPQTLDALLGKGGAEAFVSSGLGETVGNLVRVKGTAGRIEWHRNLKENAHKGGRPRKATDAEETGKPTGLGEPKPTGSEKRNPLAPAPAPAPAPTEREADDAADAAPLSQVAARVKPRAHQLPADWAPSPQHVAYAQQHGIDLDHEAAKFRAHAEAQARMAVRWNAAFSQWLMQSRDYRPKKPAEPVKVWKEWR